MANEYATLAAFKGALTGSNYSGQDIELQQVLTAASRQIDGHCGRAHGFWQDSSVVVREFYADDSTCCYVEDISTTTGLVVKVDDNDDGTFATTLTISTNFILLPLNAADEVPTQPFNEIRIVDTTGGSAFPVSSSGRPGVQVTAKFGWPAIPEDVETACIIQASMLLKGPAAPFGGVELGEASTLRLRTAIHPMAEALLEPFCRPRVA